MSSRRLSTRALTEGAMFAALTVIVSLAARYLPVVGFLFHWVQPLPVFVVTARQGGRAGMLAALAAALLLAMLAGPLAVLVYTAPILLIGWFLGYGYRRGWGFTYQAGVAALLNVAGVYLAFATARLFTSQATIRETVRLVKTQWQSLTDTLVRSYRQAGVPTEVIQQLQTASGAFARLITDYFWLLATFGAAFWGLMMYFVVRALARRLGYTLPGVPHMLPFAEWRLPRWTVLFPLFAFALGVVQTRGLPWVGPLAQGLWIVSSLVFPVIGLAFAYALLKRVGTAKPLAVVILLFLFMTPVFSGLLLAAGIWETVAGLRRQWQLEEQRRTQNEGDSEEQGEGPR